MFVYVFSVARANVEKVKTMMTWCCFNCISETTFWTLQIEYDSGLLIQKHCGYVGNFLTGLMAKIKVVSATTYRLELPTAVSVM